MMKSYTHLKLGAMALAALCLAACFGGETPGVLGNEQHCLGNGGGGGAGGAGGAGGSPDIPVVCNDSKRIRILDPIEGFGTPATVRYDSLDRMEERVEGTTLPITQLAVGDVIHVDPLPGFPEEVVTVTDEGYGTGPDGLNYRAFTAVFKRDHVVDAPAATPIKDGCPAFAMPVQETCEKHGVGFDIPGACFKQECVYGEYMLVPKPENTPCGFSSNGTDFVSGTCYNAGGGVALCGPKP